MTCCSLPVAGLAREFGVKNEAEAKAFASNLAWGCAALRSLSQSRFPTHSFDCCRNAELTQARTDPPAHRRLKDPNGGAWGAIQLWLPMERFDESLLLMRRTLGWSMLGAPPRCRFSLPRQLCLQSSSRRIPRRSCGCIRFATLTRELFDLFEQISRTSRCSTRTGRTPRGGTGSRSSPRPKPRRARERERERAPVPADSVHSQVMPVQPNRAQRLPS